MEARQQSQEERRVRQMQSAAVPQDLGWMDFREQLQTETENSKRSSTVCPLSTQSALCSSGVTLALNGYKRAPCELYWSSLKEKNGELCQCGQGGDDLRG